MSRCRSWLRKPGLGQMSLCCRTALTASIRVRSSQIMRKANTRVAERLTPIRQWTNTLPEEQNRINARHLYSANATFSIAKIMLQCHYTWWVLLKHGFMKLQTLFYESVDCIKLAKSCYFSKRGFIKSPVESHQLIWWTHVSNMVLLNLRFSFNELI